MASKVYKYVLVKQIDVNGEHYEKQVAIFNRADKAIEALKNSYMEEDQPIYSFSIKLIDRGIIR